MNVTVSIDSTGFRAALREWAAQTSQELAKALNGRMFYLLLRLYILIAPRNVAAARQRVKGYLNTKLSQQKKTLKLRGGKGQLQRVYLIAQTIRIKSGLAALIPSNPNFSELMKKNAAKLRRRGAAQGYVKASVVKALKALTKGGFAQWGRGASSGGKSGVTRPAVQPNAALAKIAGEYGGSVADGNVGVFRTSKGAATLAVPGINPIATASLDVQIRDGQDSRVANVVNPAMNQALADETREMERHLTQVAQDLANRYQEKALAITV